MTNINDPKAARPYAIVRDRYGERLRRLQRTLSPDEIVYAWSKENPDALDSFANWFDKQVVTKHMKYPVKAWMLSIARIDEKKPYGPDNCELITRSEAVSKTTKHKVTKTLIAAVKEYLKEHPDTTVTAVAQQFRPYSHTTIRKIVLEIREKKL